jgi:subtilisin-like proprotein convertase family protein
MRVLFTIIIALLTVTTGQAQGNLWRDISPEAIRLAPDAKINFTPQDYRTLQLDFDALQTRLQEAPMEFTAEAMNQPLQIELPLPNGEINTFAVVTSPVLAPGIGSRYPSIQAYKGRSVSNAAISTRFSIGPRGFHAIITTPEGSVFIDPYTRDNRSYYTAFYTKDATTHLEGFQLDCGFEPAGVDHEVHQDAIEHRNNGAVSLSVYTIGLASSGEYASYHGASTKEQVLAEMVQIINRCNQVLELETAVRLVIAENTDEAIFLDNDTDPYTDGSEVGESYGQTADILNQYIGVNNYDIGHSFIAFCGGGTVGIGGGRACNNDLSDNRFKGFGISCQFENNNAFAVELVCHEIGHQLSASHTFNNCQGNEENAVSTSAYEPGGGSTIMSYTGACQSQIIVNNADDYYHTINVEQIRSYTQTGLGSTCPEVIPTNNEMPTIELGYEDGFYIPIGTPFELTAEGGDPDGDAITYCWEQFDLGPASNIGNPNLNSPIFRSFPPTNNPTRVFPRLNKIISNTSDNTEVLPTYSRDLTFRCTVRDNNPEAGGAVWEQVAFEADQTAGPFTVTYPSGNGITWNAGDYVEVTWDVANTTNPRVDCQYINIKLSTDGGFTYPVTLLENTPNDGSAFVSVPDLNTIDARVRIEASNNIFFDISNQNFAIQPATEATYIFEVTPASIPLYCLPSDPLTFDISSEALLGYNMPITLSLSGDALPASSTASFASDQIIPGESTLLTIDLGGFIGRDTFNLVVEGTTDDLGTFSRELRFIAVSTDFSGLAMTSPENGTNGIFLSTAFTWNGISGADSYDIEIATSPAFGNTILETAEGLTETSYTPEALFENDEIYYWRIRPNNICGSGEYLTPFAFYTASVECEVSNPNDLPISIPTSVNTKESKIFVPENGIISDVNVTGVDIAFLPINSLEISLISPEGKTVVMYDNECLNTGQISLSFDDDAPTDIICPPISGNPMRPVNPLSEFINDQTQGEWTLRVSVTTSGFGSGNINDWALEFCSTATPSAPTLLTNNALEVPPGGANPISKDLLETSDEMASPSQLKYVLVSVPENGSLFRASDPEPLTPGESFTQQTINALNLFYLHDGSDTDTDEFVFIVENGAGALIPNQTFNILIDEGAVVNTHGLVAGNTLEVFPNPAQSIVNMRLQHPLSSVANVRLLNVQGQVVQQAILSAGQQQLEMNTSALAAGLYFIELNANSGKITQKLVIQR